MIVLLILIKAAMLTKVMPDIYKSVWGVFVSRVACVYAHKEIPTLMALHIFGYIQFVAKTLFADFIVSRMSLLQRP